MDTICKNCGHTGGENGTTCDDCGRGIYEGPDQKFYTITIIADGEPEVYITQAHSTSEAIDLVSETLVIDTATKLGEDPLKFSIDDFPFWVISTVITPEKPEVYDDCDKRVI